MKEYPRWVTMTIAFLFVFLGSILANRPEIDRSGWSFPLLEAAYMGMCAIGGYGANKMLKKKVTKNLDNAD